MNIFTIESQSQYYIDLQCIPNIEDAGDEFTTIEELANEGIHIGSSGGLTIFNERIGPELTRLKNELKRTGKKSMKIDPVLQEVLELAWSRQNSNITRFVSGLRRNGNKVYLHTKSERTTVKKSDFFTLRRVAELVIYDKYGFSVEFSGTHDNEVSMLKACKKLISWKDIENWLTNGEVYYYEKGVQNEGTGQKKWIKKLFQNPELFNTI